MAPPRYSELDDELDAVNKRIDQALDALTADQDVVVKARDLIFSIFIDDVDYPDPETGKTTRFTGQLNEKEERKLETQCPRPPENATQDAIEEYNEKRDAVKNEIIAEKLFKKGQTTLMECNRFPGNAQDGMVWYALTHGITTKELYELGKSPYSNESGKVMAKLSQMKQGYINLINSNDPKKLAEFFMGAFKEFKKCDAKISEMGTLDGFQKNWKDMMFWSGVGAMIQQNIPKKWRLCSPLQQQLVTELNTQIGQKWKGANLKTVTTAMNALHTAYNRMTACNKTWKKKENVDTYERPKAYSDAANMVQIFHVIKEQRNREFLRTGKAPGLFSPQAAKSAFMAENGIPELNNGFEKRFYLGQRRFLTGDNTGCLFYDAGHVCDWEEASLNEDRNPVSLDIDSNKMASFFPAAELDDLFEACEAGDQEGKTPSEVIREKINGVLAQNRLLNGVEIAAYLTDKELCGEKERNILAAFTEKNELLRLSKLSPEMQGILRSISLARYGVEPEDYISNAAAVGASCKQAARKNASAIRKGKTRDLINTKANNALLDGLRKSLKAVDVTVGSSKEFKNLAAAFRAVDKMAANNRIRGNEHQYQDNLRYLAQTAAEYVRAKESDGKKDRFTDKGQRRLNMAKRMKAFALASAEGIDLSRTALQQRNLEHPFEDQLPNPGSAENETERQHDDSLIEINMHF